MTKGLHLHGEDEALGVEPFEDAVQQVICTTTYTKKHAEKLG
jgi:hypothetical protein